MERAELARWLGVSLASGAPRDVVVAERDPAAFRAAFADAVAAGGTVFLADPAWGALERAQFDALRNASVSADRERGWLCIPTGGSSGQIKLARHDAHTIAAAVGGFCAHFGVTRVNAVGLLPLHHVSGLMGWLRCVLTGGQYVPWEGSALLAGRMPVRPAGDGDWFLSLVPTQLARLMEQPPAVEWLRSFRAVFIGGGPAWPALVEAGARLHLPLSFSYGMTETAAMVTALRPEEFLAAARGCGSALPHASVTLDTDGVVVIRSASLFRGYYPAMAAATVWSPQDLGRLDERGSLHLLGRRDGLIITGGEKVNPTEVEAALRETGLFNDVAVLGLPDERWGEAVTAFYPQGSAELDLARVEGALAGLLAAYKRPKRFIAVAEWPRNAQGKVNRTALRGSV
ncbi:MAG TPA: AMP-binding protein [Opitutaceae bacterium]